LPALTIAGEWNWQLVFPQDNRWKNTKTGDEGRHHTDESLDGPGTPGSQGREDDHVLHTCAQPGTGWRSQPR